MSTIVIAVHFVMLLAALFSVLLVSVKRHEEMCSKLKEKDRELLLLNNKLLHVRKVVNYITGPNEDAEREPPTIDERPDGDTETNR